MTPPPNHFDRSKPFYPIVMHTIGALHGFSDLAARGACQKVNEMKRTGLSNADIPEELVRFNVSGMTPLLAKMEFKCKGQSESIGVDVDELAEEAVNNGSYLSSHFMKAWGMALILAWEAAAAHHDKGSVWEFLRHCRNAAAHNGKFHFRHGEPTRGAKWRNLEILPPLQGTPLFIGKSGEGFLYPGDVMALLWDIEQACPQLSVT